MRRRRRPSLVLTQFFFFRGSNLVEQCVCVSAGGTGTNTLPSHYVTGAMRAVTLDVTPRPQSGGDAQARCLINASQHRRVMTHTHTHTLVSGEGERSPPPSIHTYPHMFSTAAPTSPLSLSLTHTHTPSQVHPGER